MNETLTLTKEEQSFMDKNSFSTIEYIYKEAGCKRLLIGEYAELSLEIRSIILKYFKEKYTKIYNRWKKEEENEFNNEGKIYETHKAKLHLFD